MATAPQHSNFAIETTPQPANAFGFTPDMLAAISKQNFAGCQPFAGTMPGAAPPHFEEAAAILLALGKGFEARVESPLMPGQSEHDLLEPKIFALALEGVASLIHTGLLLQRVAGR